MFLYKLYKYNNYTNFNITYYNIEMKRCLIMLFILYFCVEQINSLYIYKWHEDRTPCYLYKKCP